MHLTGRRLILEWERRHRLRSGRRSRLRALRLADPDRWREEP